MCDLKKYILIAGVNGAGKSTLYQSLQSLQKSRNVIWQHFMIIPINEQI